MKKRKFNFGDKVKDTISGYTGVIVTFLEYDRGCIQYAVQAKAPKVGKLPHPEYIDEGHLELAIPVQKKEKEKPIRRRGGLMRTRPRHDEDEDDGQ